MISSKSKKMYCHFSQTHHQKGISLIETMIGLTLGLVLIFGLVQILTANRQSSRMQEALSEIQDNGRLAMEFIAREIRKADYWGCAEDIDDFVNHLDPSSSAYDANLHDFTNVEGISGTEGDGLNGSDSITVGRLQDGGQMLIAGMADVGSPLTVDAGNGFTSGQVLFVSNCRGGDIFQNTSSTVSTDGSIIHETGNVSPGNLTTACPNAPVCSGGGINCLCQVYGTEAMVFPGIHVARYFIAMSADGLHPTLWVNNFEGNFELARGVEQMQITYGEDTDNDNSANRYFKANNPNLDMENVVSIKVNLLLQSTSDNITDGSQPHRFNWEERTAEDTTASATIETNDRRLRRAYTMTISIRNRMI
ncbi:MAG: PilW family protein [Pseudomonadota bacterium]